MTTTLVRPTAVTDHVPRLGAWIAGIVAVHLALWGIVMAGGWLYWDDFILQGQAARLGLSTDLLLNNHDGHVMPATYLAVWMIQEISGLDYTLVAVTMLLGELILIAAAITGFRALLGRGVPMLIALAVFLLNPIMLPGLTWWSAALTLVPLMSCALFATATHIRYLRTGSRAAMVTTFALVIVALSFFEKSILIPVWLVLVSVLAEPDNNFASALRTTISARWRLWTGWLALLIAYLAFFAQAAEGRTGLPTGPGQVFELLTRALFNTIAVGLAGGPVRWTPVDYSASFSDPPPWMIGLGILVGGTVVIAGVRRASAARKAWTVAAVYLFVDLAAFALGRLGENGDPAVVQAGRYVATSMIPISVAIAVTAAQYRAQLLDARWRWPLVGVGALVGGLALVSSLSYAAIWSKNPAEIWVGNARTDLAATDQGVPLLDQEVPDFLLLPVTHPYNQISWFLAPLSPQPGIATSTSDLRLLDNRGRLVPADVEGPADIPTDAGCYPVPAGASVRVPLQSSLIPWIHTVAIAYTAQTPGFVNVGIGDGTPVAAEVTTGRHELFVRAEGGENWVTVTSVDATLCLDSVRVGRVVPRDLPYGGGVDLTEQLQNLP